MFDLLAPGKKISLLASLGIAFMMLTAFVACLTEDGGNINWAEWLCYYSVIAYGVVLFFGELDIKNNKADMARVATCVFALAGTVGLVSGVIIFTMIMFILAFLASAAAVILPYLETQTVNYVHCIVAFAFFLLMVFMIVIVAGGGSVTLALMMYDFPTALFALAAGYNAYMILKEA